MGNSPNSKTMGFYYRVSRSSLENGVQFRNSAFTALWGLIIGTKNLKIFR